MNRPHLDYKIHRQSGDFYRSFSFGVTVSQERYIASVRNRSRHAKYLRGTRLMRPRPVLEEAVRQTRGSRAALTRRLIRQSLQ